MHAAKRRAFASRPRRSPLHILKGTYHDTVSWTAIGVHSRCSSNAQFRAWLQQVDALVVREYASLPIVKGRCADTEGTPRAHRRRVLS